KKYDQALDVFASAERKLNHPFSFLATEGRANALMELQRFADAEVLLKRLSEQKENPLRSEHLYRYGQALEAQKKTDAALAAYRSVETQYPGSGIIESARERIALLTTK